MVDLLGRYSNLLELQAALLTLREDLDLPAPEPTRKRISRRRASL